MKTIQHISLAIIIAILASCKGSNTVRTTQDGDTLKLKYAQRLQIIEYDGYRVVKLADPWNKGNILHTYVLVPEGKATPKHLPEGSIVRVPLKSTVIATSVHCGLVMSLGKADNIKGVCDKQYIHMPEIIEGCNTGKIIDCGSGISPTLEKIIDLSPDALFLSPFQNSGGYGRLENLGIPIIEMADYMETSALGRAEWMKFYGMLFGAEKEANKMFSEVEKEYNSLKNLATTSKVKRTIMMDKQTGSVWYVPGGNGTVGKVIADAGINYAFSNDNHSGSLALSFEKVLESCGNADIWLFRYNSPQDITKKGLESENKGYNQFKAFKDGEIYGCNTATSTFYEDTPFHPDRLLRDFVIIGHPDLKNLGDPKYFLKVEK